MDQKVRLRWTNHQDTVLSMFDNHLSTQTFVDVTLACEGKYIRAHKLVLSACSTYFQELLSLDVTKSPIVYLKDVKYSELQALIRFMYRGKVTVPKNELLSFLSVAQGLKIRGLNEIESSVACSSSNISRPSDETTLPIFTGTLLQQSTSASTTTATAQSQISKNVENAVTKLASSTRHDLIYYNNNSNSTITQQAQLPQSTPPPPPLLQNPSFATKRSHTSASNAQALAKKTKKSFNPMTDSVSLHGLLPLPMHLRPSTSRMLFQSQTITSQGNENPHTSFAEGRRGDTSTSQSSQRTDIDPTRLRVSDQNQEMNNSSIQVLVDLTAEKSNEINNGRDNGTTGKLSESQGQGSTSSNDGDQNGGGVGIDQNLVERFLEANMNIDQRYYVPPITGMAGLISSTQSQGGTSNAGNQNGGGGVEDGIINYRNASSEDRQEFSCHKCGKTYIRMQWLLYHLSAECGKYKCKYCTHTTKQKSNMKTHERTCDHNPMRFFNLLNFNS